MQIMYNQDDFNNMQKKSNLQSLDYPSLGVLAVQFYHHQEVTIYTETGSQQHVSTINMQC